MPVRGLTALAIASAALAICAIPAFATTDRADYAAHANSICSSTNAQVEALNHSRAKNAGDQIVAAFRSELTALDALAPAPGDESIVSSWLSNRHLIQDLVETHIALDRHLQRLDERVFNGKHGPRAVKRFLKRERRIDRRLSRMARQVEQAAPVDVQLGWTLGATECEGIFTAQELLQG